MGILTPELLSMRVSCCRGPFSQHPATPQPGVLGLNLASLLDYAFMETVLIYTPSCIEHISGF